MDFFTKFNLTPIKVLKISGIALLGLILLIFVLSITKSTLNSRNFGGSMPGIGREEMAYESDADYGMDESSTKMSLRNVSESMDMISPPMIPEPQGPSGNMAEDFEVTSYSASIESADRTHACKTISDLKPLSHVIFENTNEHDQGCNYTFKVERAKVEEILAIIKGLDPKHLSENSYTIKRQVDDFTSETEILEKKRASIDETLENAMRAYDQITALATSVRDAESLAKIINSKIQIIERLANERIAINEQLDRLTRTKEEQLDQLAYTYFYVNVTEQRYVDVERIKDSWQMALKNFFFNVNKAFQDATINLIGFLFMLIPYVLYFFILLVAAKYGWKAVKRIWVR